MSISTSIHAVRMHGGANVTERFAAALQRAYSQQRHAVKRLATRIDRDPRAVRAWFGAECSPSAEALILLCAESAEMEREFLAMVAERRAATCPPG